MRILSAVFSIAIALTAAAFLFYIHVLIPYSGDDAYFRQPNFFPIVTLVLVLVLGLGLSIKYAWGGRLPLDEELSGSKLHFNILGPLAATFIGYILLVPWTGYLLTTLLFGCVALLVGRHLNMRSAISMLLLGLTLYLVFVAYLDVWFPEAPFALERLVK
ncbi:MAG: tripartite tricarboxylate transporter TctB family protein [Nitratireductor sp.]|nr:tripartite tricarboxylate transporter TctB family protein [Nitratireductor sp.]MCC0022292.1 tripartite tricarboxylate transporter TctB family protein [Nitratireductor sp.]